jgi:poly-beta-1,6-N-acetyl-D-glucosamine synthase
MTFATALLFYVAAGLLLYAYVLYPVLLLAISAVSEPKPAKLDGLDCGTYWPSISVIVAAYNEDGVIADKINNFLECAYPGQREIIVVSDASKDHTDDIVRSLQSSQVRLLIQPRRLGKGAALNRGVLEAQGDILVFSDASSMFVQETLTQLIAPFRDPSVGLVNGRIHYSQAQIANLYHRYERFLRALEVRQGLIATAHGAIYALRRRLWHPHDTSLVNDFLHPILTNLQGYRVSVAPQAHCYEKFTMDTQFSRQVRMVALAALVYFRVVPQLLRERRWRCLLVLTSHKFLRWLTALWLLLLAGTSPWLAASGGVYRLVLVGEVGLAALAAIGFVASKLKRDERLSFVYRFLALNVAAILGLWLCTRRRVPTVWKPNAM